MEAAAIELTGGAEIRNRKVFDVYVEMLEHQPLHAPACQQGDDGDGEVAERILVDERFARDLPDGVCAPVERQRARKHGPDAAPTHGVHFDVGLLERLEDADVGKATGATTP